MYGQNARSGSAGMCHFAAASVAWCIIGAEAVLVMQLGVECFVELIIVLIHVIVALGQCHAAEVQLALDEVEARGNNVRLAVVLIPQL